MVDTSRRLVRDGKRACNHCHANKKRCFDAGVIVVQNPPPQPRRRQPNAEAGPSRTQSTVATGGKRKAVDEEEQHAAPKRARKSAPVAKKYRFGPSAGIVIEPHSQPTDEAMEVDSGNAPTNIKARIAQMSADIRRKVAENKERRVAADNLYKVYKDAVDRFNALVKELELEIEELAGLIKENNAAAAALEVTNDEVSADHDDNEEDEDE